MAVNLENLRWAESDLTDPITGRPNKNAPDTSFKSSGLNRGEPLPRPFVNYMFDQYHGAFSELQSQIDALVLDAGQSVLQKAFPIGSLYQSTTSSVSPSDASVLGFGTWVRIKGKFLVGIDESDSSFDGVGETGGSKTHNHTDTFSVNNHTLTPSQIPAHTHDYRDRYYVESSSGVSTATYKEAAPTNYNAKRGSGNSDNDNTTFLYIDATTEQTGSSASHNHGISGGVNSASSLPPYQTIYMWKRTA